VKRIRNADTFDNRAAEGRMEPDSMMKTANPTKVLFVCGRNQRRLPTAGSIFNDGPRMPVRPAHCSRKTVRSQILNFYYCPQPPSFVVDECSSLLS